MLTQTSALTVTLVSLVPLTLAGCLYEPRLSLPDPSVIGFESGRAVPPDCSQLSEPSYLVDAGYRRPSVAFGCATLTNLAAMLARPEDLVAPLPYAGADANLATAAVRRLEEDHVKQPSTPSSTTTTTLP